MKDLSWKWFEMTGLPAFYLAYKQHQTEQLHTEETKTHEHQRTDHPGNGFWGI